MCFCGAKLCWWKVPSSIQGTQDKWMQGYEGGSHEPHPSTGTCPPLAPCGSTGGGCRLCCSLDAGLVSRRCRTQTRRPAGFLQRPAGLRFLGRLQQLCPHMGTPQASLPRQGWLHKAFQQLHGTQ